MTGSGAPVSDVARKDFPEGGLVADETASRQAAADETDLPDVAADWVEQRYRELVDHSPHAIIVHEAGRLVYANPAAVRWMAGTSADQLLGHAIAEFVQLASVPAFLVRLSALQNLGDASEPSEAVLSKFDGTTLDVEAISVLTMWEGRPAYQVVFRDISAQKAAEANLRLQTALTRAVSDAVISTTRDGIVTGWNPAAETIYRRSAAEALNQPIRAMVGARLDLAGILAAGGVTHVTHRIFGGSERAVRVSVAATDSGFLVVVSDQTASRRAVFLEAVLGSLHDAVVVVDRQGNVGYANFAAKRVLGIERSDGSASTAVPPALAAFIEQLLDGQLVSGADAVVDGSVREGGPVNGPILDFSSGDDGRRVVLRVTSRLLDPENPDHSDILLSFADGAAAPLRH